MDDHPVGKVSRQAQLGDGLQIFAGLDRRVGGSSTVGFDQEGDATVKAQLGQVLKDSNIFLEAENIAASLAIDENDLATCSKFKLGFQTLDMILISLPLSQNLSDQQQTTGTVETRNLCR